MSTSSIYFGKYFSPNLAINEIVVLVSNKCRNLHCSWLNIESGSMRA